MITALLLSALSLAATPVQEPVDATPLRPEAGRWRAELECPGGALPFLLDLEYEGSKLLMWLVNGEERILVQNSRVRRQMLLADIPRYQSRLRGTLAEDGRSMTGVWSKTGPKMTATKMEFWAERSDAPRFEVGLEGLAGEEVSVGGRWAVRFSSSSRPAVGVFEQETSGRVTGTFLTSLGDYRYLEGDFREGKLRLSCFDGAHAFLFHGLLGKDGHLRGEFWSRDTWHETWIAERDPDAKLEDPFQLSRWREGVNINELSFLDVKKAEMVSLGDESLKGPLRLIQLFGTWCPNCHDETPFLVELWDTYHEQGLQVVGIAFEYSGNQKRDAIHVQHFGNRYQVPYTLMLGGTSDKGEATKAFGGLEEILAYPTVLFVDAANQVRHVHTGFSGPATGKEHEREKERFHELVVELLAEAAEEDR